MGYFLVLGIKRVLKANNSDRVLVTAYKKQQVVDALEELRHKSLTRVVSSFAETVAVASKDAAEENKVLRERIARLESTLNILSHPLPPNCPSPIPHLKALEDSLTEFKRLYYVGDDPSELRLVGDALSKVLMKGVVLPLDEINIGTQDDDHIHAMHGHNDRSGDIEFTYNPGLTQERMSQESTKPLQSASSLIRQIAPSPPIPNTLNTTPSIHTSSMLTDFVPSPVGSGSVRIAP